ncbi:hypothetical protein MNB_SV-6-1180 [hydrothermal vent metagenome]|uniref:Uncharacterized protein n=1 Tax=hydrothermal vent metagenome TaxID=652676 RepID=A0A1W1C9N9_9ZZZZ
MAKRATFVVFAIFLFSFHKYAPYPPKYIVERSTIQSIFDLYYFISNQVFGIVHEGGHGVCYILPCPRFLTAINGTIFQLLFPAGIGYYYYRRDNLLAANIGIFFTGFTMHYTAWYISTSHEGAIVPASKSFLGKDGYHDFHYILDTLGVLPYDGMIAGIVRFISYLLMLYAIGRLYWIAFVAGED